MKRVSKGPSPTEFEEWKAKANHEWQPTYDSLQNPEKRIVHEALLSEQGHVCCYCGQSISLASSHIEHFRPQESDAQLALEFGNLHASCIRETTPGLPLHCGHAKGSGYDDELMISPLDAKCEQRFIYSVSNGAVYPTDLNDESARHMVKLLCLDISFLRDRRLEVLRRVFDDEFVSTSTDDELERLARACRQPDANGRLTGLDHIVARYAEQILKRALGDAAPG